MTQDMIVEKALKAGESGTCEFKLSLAVKDNAAKAICAMANTSGGIVLIGLAEKKYYSDKMPPYDDSQIYRNDYIIYGVSDEDRDRRELSSHLWNNTNYRTGIERIYKAASVHLCGKKLILIEVFPLFSSSRQLVTYKGKVYRRLDNQTVALNIDEVVDLMSAAGQKVKFVPQITQSGDERDAAEMYADALRVVQEAGKASTSLLQRRLRIGYGRASRLIDELESNQIIGPAVDSRPREVLNHMPVNPVGLVVPESENTSMYEEAVRVCIIGRKASTSYLQRRLKIGYGRAAKLIELLEQNGIIAKSDGVRPRQVLVHDLNEAMNKTRKTGG